MSEKKQDQVFDHDYDGIQEYDNRLPNWWLAILYGTVVFAFVYWLYFHTFGAAPTPEERYEAELVAAAEAQLARTAGQQVTNESLTLLSTIPDRVAAGQEIFNQFCVVCHNQRGEGNVGPNLTDAYWIHGSTPLDVHGVVTHGVLEKGMAAWGSQLGPTRVQAVVAYVMTLKNTNVAGKAPQGDLVTAEQEAERVAAQDAELAGEMETEPGETETEK